MQDQKKIAELLPDQQLDNASHSNTKIATVEEGMILQLADGSIPACNTMAEQILGLTGEQIHGWSSPESSWRFVHKNGTPLTAVTHPAMVALRTGKPCWNIVVGLSKPNTELKWLLMNSQPLFLAHDTSPYAVVSTFSDINQQQADQIEDNVGNKDIISQDITQNPKIKISPEAANAEVVRLLADDETKLKKLFESQIIGIFLTDFGKIIAANDIFFQLVGYTREDLLSEEINWRQITPLEYHHLDEKAWQELLKFGSFTPFEKQYIRKDGNLVPILICGAILQQSPPNCICFVMDLSDRQKAQKSLGDVMQRLTFHEKNSPLGVIEWDAEFRISRWSPAAEKIFGWSDQQVIGKKFDDWQFVFGEDIEIVQNALERLSHRESQVLCCNRNYTKDGSVVHCEWYNSALCDQSGKLISVLSQVLDVTERKQVEVEREKMLARLPSAGLCPSQEYTRQLNGLMEAALAINSALSIEEVNRIITEQAREIIGAHQAVTSITIDEDSAKLISWASLSDKYAAWRSQNQQQLGLCINTSVRLLNRSVRMTQTELEAHPQWQQFTQQIDKHPPMRGCLAAPLIGRDGHNMGLIQLSDKYKDEFTKEDEAIIVQLAQMASVAIENTRLYEAEQQARAQAEEANCIKDEFLAVLSHELRSPLNPILGWAKLLQSRKFDDNKTASALATIERNAKLQAQLIEDLLDISRILQGKLTLNVAQVNLKLTIDAAMETVRLAAEAKSINLKFLSDTDFTALVIGDPNRLQQVFWNLLSNAVKFTPAGGRVQICLECIDSHIQIQVMDTGKGIEPNFLAHVFDYFRQADSATTRKFGGLGLGLAIVRQLVELHGGRVFADSAGEGQGATFTVQLPVLPTQLITADSNSEPEMDSNLGNLEGIKILVVDDDFDSRDFICFVLEEEGAEVVSVSSAMEALQSLPESKADVLLSDIGMPEMDGYTLIRQVRTWTSEEGGKIPAIALTAYAGEYNQQQAISAGFQMHVTKPAEPSQLVAAVARLVGKRVIGH
ncbi:PAS domain S-box protein [Nodularia sphaerocarpa]|uniref:PAS domain S-box protein n=1 Tax=Nodularia sphaerocarpa TaxID=137816 RepID=UPI001EFABEE5|nr:PAS domain S-box protein [Nodularia sphaerocarpa]MDB9375124.1 PAS domain S-box protein [Nodularia sphaerocarpa CS-585]MDB9378703.1 PAS domain S-box protein [Nodularia sphaerocarpa CS-585A2]ULP73507.1 Autoinducer 2 sensor kinase/phosphatase LuxQ [Nodularia sphaerocarpa UHCC 0038]